MDTASSAHFDRHYQSHLKHLKLKGLQPKTVEAYSRVIRRIGDYFDHRIDDLTEAQLTDYFSELFTSLENFGRMAQKAQINSNPVIPAKSGKIYDGEPDPGFAGVPV